MDISDSTVVALTERWRPRKAAGQCADMPNTAFGVYSRRTRHSKSCVSLGRCTPGEHRDARNRFLAGRLAAGDSSDRRLVQLHVVEFHSDWGGSLDFQPSVIHQDTIAPRSLGVIQRCVRVCEHLPELIAG
jgi:hypothetical protein